MNIIKKSEIVKIFPQRNPNSHKGQNGRVLIIGGSLDYFGAPILAALGAYGGGADLVYLLVPECNFEVSRSFYPDFIVRKYPGNFVNSRALDAAQELLPKVDCVLIGPGVSENPESLRVITRIIQKAECQAVLDAEAIPAMAELGLPSEAGAKAGAENPPRFTITPNRAEMDEITEGSLPHDPEEEAKKDAPFGRSNQAASLRLGLLIEDFAKKWNVTILLKKPQDIIAAPGKLLRLNQTGNAGMTVGGSGDVLSGFVASLIAQHVAPYEACMCAAYLLGAAGDNLYRQKGFNYMATDLALELPYAIHGVIG